MDVENNIGLNERFDAEAIIIKLCEVFNDFLWKFQ